MGAILVRMSEAGIDHGQRAGGKVGNNVLLSALALVIANAFVSASGFLREASLAYAYGTDRTADAVAVLFFIFETLTVVVVSGIAPYMLVPLVAGTRDRGDHDQDAVSSIVTLGVVGISALWLVVFLLGPLLVPGVPGLPSGAGSELTVRLLRYSGFALPVIAFCGLVGAVLQGRGAFVPPAIGRVGLNVSVALAVWFLAQRLGAEASAVALIGGSLVQLGIVIIALRRVRFPLNVRFRLEPRITALIRAGAPALVAFVLVSVAQPTIERVILSQLPPGYLAAGTYAWRLFYLFLGLAVALQTVAFTRLAAHGHASVGGEERAHVVRSDLRSSAFVLIPISVAIWLLREPLAAMAFLRGEFDARSLELTVSAFSWYILTLLPAHLFGLMLRTQIAFRSSGAAARLAAVWVVLSIGIQWSAADWLSLRAIPLGSGVASLACALIGMRLIERLTASSLISGFIQNTGAALAATLVAAVPLIAWRFFYTEPGRPSINQILIMGAAGIAGVVIYGAIVLPRLLGKPLSAILVRARAN